jgi:hypothetical protein
MAEAVKFYLFLKQGRPHRPNAGPLRGNAGQGYRW